MILEVPNFPPNVDAINLDEPASIAHPRPIPSDAASLTRAMARGDEAAFRAFFDRYFDRMLRYLLVVTNGDEHAAREALQAAFIRVARNVKPFDDEEKFWSWLTVVARTAAADESKKKRRWFAFLERFSRQTEVEVDPGNNGSADEKLRGLLEHQLNLLPTDERELVVQKYISRCSVREIACTQQTTEKAVESKLSRIRRKLKDAVMEGLKHERPH